LQKNGIENEFEQHIKENESLLCKLCRVYTNVEAERDDLFQEIVIQLWRFYPNFKGDSKFSTWLYRIAINTAVTGLRKKKHKVVSFEEAGLPIYDITEDIGDETEERFRQLYEAINTLNPIDKAIVILYMEDRAYEEMEEVLGISQGNLRVKMNRIKDKLRQQTKNN
jgi:RNA polymerase sigma factor (sigma-70 family)